MKIFLCVRCNELFNFKKTYQECSGGHGGAQYADPHTAKVWGDFTVVFVLGFANSTLGAALRDQRADGDQTPEYKPGYGTVSLGRQFTAFVMPESTISVIRSVEKFEPISYRII